ncbi:MAG: BatD family protein [Planctomycetota bacterium]
MRPTAAVPFALLIASAGAQLGQSGPEPAVVAVGEVATFTLRLDDAAPDAALGLLPTIDGLRLAADAPLRTTRQVLRGSQLAEVGSARFRVQIEATRAGTFVLPPLAVEQAGATLTTTPVRLEALDAAGDDMRAFVEVRTEPPDARPWLQQPVDLVLRFGFARGFVEEGLIPMFARPLDLPVQVRWGWPGGAAGVVELPAASADAETVRFALDEGVATARRAGEEERHGQVFATFEVRRRIAATASGALVVPGPVLRFAYATRFDDDFLDGRVAVDRHEARVRTAPCVIDVEPLPDAARPAAFSGAVGEFAVRTRATSASVRTGDSLQFVVEVTGTGNLATFAPPGLSWPGWHALGCTSSLRDHVRVLTYDITPTDVEVREIPAFALAYFDPNAGAYRTAHSAALPVAVSPGTTASAKPSAPSLVAGVDDIYPAPSVSTPSGDPHALPRLHVALALGLPWLLALTLSLWLRARGRRRRDPLGQRARRAAATFARAMQTAGTDPADAFADYLAARLHSPRAAVVGPDLEARLHAAGVAPTLAARAATTLHDLLGSRYGGARVDDASALASLVTALEASFPAPGGRK